MPSVVAAKNHIPLMSEASVAKTRELESVLLKEPQLPLTTKHLIHGGVYFRTIQMQADTLLAGAFIKIATTLVSGCVTIYMTGGGVFFGGYNVLPASGGRKQAILAHTVSDLTMVFPTLATTVAEAEAEFTDELDLLVSNTGDNETTITGEY